MGGGNKRWERRNQFSGVPWDPSIPRAQREAPRNLSRLVGVCLPPPNPRGVRALTPTPAGGAKKNNRTCSPGSGSIEIDIAVHPRKASAPFCCCRVAHVPHGGCSPLVAPFLCFFLSIYNVAPGLPGFRLPRGALGVDGTPVAAPPHRPHTPPGCPLREGHFTSAGGSAQQLVRSQSAAIFQPRDSPLVSPAFSQGGFCHGTMRRIYEHSFSTQKFF